MSRFPEWYAKGLNQSYAAFPAGWDLATINGDFVAGRSLITGGGLTMKVDPRKTKGANAAHPTTHGLDVAEFNLRIAVIDRDDMDLVDRDIIQRYCPPVNVQPVTLDHPQLRSIIQLLGKLDVLILGVTPWTPSSAIRRGMEVSLKLLHWPAAQRVKGSSNTATKPRPPNLITDAAKSNPQPSTDSKHFAPPFGAT